MGFSLVSIISEIGRLKSLLFAHIGLGMIIGVGGISTGGCIIRALYSWLTFEEEINDKEEIINDTSAE